MEATDGARERAVDADSEEGVTGAGGAEMVLVEVLVGDGCTLSLGTPDKLGALLCVRLGGWLGALLEGGLAHSLSGGEEESTTEDGAEFKVDVESCGGQARTSFSKAKRVCPGSLGYAPASGDGNGTLTESFAVMRAVLAVSSTSPFEIGFWIGLDSALKGRGVWSSCGGLSELSGPSPSVCEVSEASGTVIVDGKGEEGGRFGGSCVDERNESGKKGVWRCDFLLETHGGKHV